MTGAGTNRKEVNLTGGPSIILVEPQLGENIGMAARAMANFGLSDLRLVNPRDNWLNQKTEAASAGAAHIVKSATVYSSINDAIADLKFLYATTARERGQGKPVHGPQEAGAIMKARIKDGQKIGVLFGRERTGLENEDIALADAICTFPVNPAYASLNLSQAVLLIGFSYMTADGKVDLPFVRKTKWPPADRDAVINFFEFLENTLEERGFFRPPHKKRVMSMNLRNIFHRIGMDEQDLRTLRGMVVRLIEGPREPQSKKRKKQNAASEPDA